MKLRESIINRSTLHCSVYFLILTCFLQSGLCSRITFENGYYNNILVALHPDTDPTNCIQLVHNISEAFKTASSYLEQATNELTRFGTIRILIPPNWGSALSFCDIPEANITESTIYNSYESADFKITKNHPFASKLPWTKQYKGCENESDSVFVPTNFFKTPFFDSNARGRILLHEWAKFRYGVFEEFGYYNDPIFSPCFSMGGKDLYTSCTDVELTSLRNSGPNPITNEECRLALQQKSQTLLAQMKSSTASIMFAPHLGNIVKFCTNETQIGLAPTKQNVLCDRKSVSEVVFSHEDFKQIKSDSIFPNTRGIRTPRLEPSIALIRKSATRDQGYAFLLEDDDAIREFGRLPLVKQGIAQILRLAKDQTQIALGKYDGIVFKFTAPQKLENDDEARIRLLSNIPESNTSRLLDLYKIGRSNRRLNDKYRSIQNIIEELSAYSSIKWEIIHVTSSPPANISRAIAEIQKTEHSLTILTFDTSKDWLQFNSIPNTNKLIFLPQCAVNDMACYGTASSLIVDHFAQISATNTSVDRHFVHKVIDVSFDGGAERTFTVSTDKVVQNLNNFHFLLPVYEVNTALSIVSPDGMNCAGVPLLGYGLVLTIDSGQCPYKAGIWKVRVSGTVESYRYTLQGYGETLNTNHDLIISASFGRKLNTEVFPSTGGLPVYISVMNGLEQPIIYAGAELRIIHENQNFSNIQSIQLLDNGMDPDLTSNDGIYSGYVKDYNSDPSYHTGQVWVTTTSGTSKAIVNLSGLGEAVLLDSNMASKCCGSFIPVQAVSDVGRSAYSVVLSSFRTGETINTTADIQPPSRISSKISVIEASLEHIVLEFTAPGSDYSEGTVAHYDICCTNSTTGNLDDSMCNRVEPKDCAPVQSGSVQSCKIMLRDLALGFLNGTQVDVDNSTQVSLYCGLRGVDAAGNSGPLSATIFEVAIDPRVMVEGFGECKYISDGCLPIAIFWALIGCLGGLILLLFIVVLCWFCGSRKKKKALNSIDDSKSVKYVGGFPEESTHPPLHNVYINQAYIQDSNGQLKLVASDGELLSFESPENGRFPSAPGVRRRSISGTDGGSRKHVSWNGGDQNDKDMPVFFAADKRGNNSSAVSLPQMDTSPALKKHNAASVSPRPSEQALPDDRVPVTLRSNFRPVSESGHNLNLPRIGNSQSIPSISSTIDQQNSGPVYASVTRAGRKSSPYSGGTGYTPAFSQPLAQGPAHGPGQFPSSYSVASTANSTARPVSNKTPVVIPPMRTSAPASSAAPTPKYIHNRPPVKMDHFPSSESEVYSDMSHIFPNSNRPTSGNFPVSSSPAHNFSRNAGTRQEINAAPRNSSPPKGTGLGPGRRDVQSMDMSRPPVFPPPPPPPRQSMPNADARKNSVAQRNQAQEDDEYDDDSDNWDNYDDIQFNNPGTGSSYA